jgi:hypothetical protein
VHLLCTSDSLTPGSADLSTARQTRPRVREANLFLTGRHLVPVDVVAKEVVAAGRSAGGAEVDALDEEAVDKHRQGVIDKAASVDISFNAVGMPNMKTVGVPLVELGFEHVSLTVMEASRLSALDLRLEDPLARADEDLLQRPTRHRRATARRRRPSQEVGRHRRAHQRPRRSLSGRPG